jgi:hypothetical protein
MAGTGCRDGASPPLAGHAAGGPQAGAIQMGERFEQVREAVGEWWASYSGFVILPFGSIAFCVTVYEMLHGVM